MADMATVSWIPNKWRALGMCFETFWNHQWTLTKPNQSDWCPWSKFVPGSQPLFYVRKKTTDNPNQMKQRIKHCHATGKLFYDKHTALLSQLPMVFPSENDRLSMCSTKYSNAFGGHVRSKPNDGSVSFQSGRFRFRRHRGNDLHLRCAHHASHHVGMTLVTAHLRNSAASSQGPAATVPYSEWALTIAAEFPLNLKLKVERVIVGGWSAPTVFHRLRSARKASPPPQCPTPPPTTASPIPSPSPIKELEPQNRSGRLLKQISSL